MAPALHSAPYRVRLAIFEGPFGLLLHLIRRQKLDIHDIPIAVITEQYLEQLELMRELNLDVAGEFLVMAATLIQIKTRCLLPRDPVGGEEDEEDPRAELVRRLVEYERFREAGEKLRRRAEEFALLYPRGAAGDERRTSGEVVVEYDLNMFDLLLAFKGLLDRAAERGGEELELSAFNVKRRMVEVMDLLPLGRRVRLSRLVSLGGERRQLLVTFLAVLELVRLRAIRIRQDAPFGPIYLTRAVKDFENGD
jgi:segregation and condensation protein A